MIRNPTPISILSSLLGPPAVASGQAILGPNEGRLLDQIEARMRGPLRIRAIELEWGPGAARLSREERAAAAIKALNAPFRLSDGITRH